MHSFEMESLVGGHLRALVDTQSFGLKPANAHRGGRTFSYHGLFYPKVGGEHIVYLRSSMLNRRGVTAVLILCRHTNDFRVSIEVTKLISYISLVLP